MKKLIEAVKIILLLSIFYLILSLNDTFCQANSQNLTDNLTLVQHFNALYYDYENNQNEYDSFDAYINEYMYFE